MELKDKLNIPEDWCNLLKEVFESDEFTQVSKKLALIRQERSVFPLPGEGLEAFRRTPLNKLRAIILGMDPYPSRFKGEPVAFGLAFTPRSELNKPSSLRVIEKEICKEYEVETKINKNDLIRWADQGVLLFNTALSVEEGKPGSHLELWNPITTKMLKIISESTTGLVVLLWGAHAKKYEPIFNQHHNVLMSGHPAAEVYGRGKFYGNNHFKKTNEIIKGQTSEADTIQWYL